MKKLILLIALLLIASNCFALQVNEPVTIQTDNLDAFDVKNNQNNLNFRINTSDNPLAYRVGIFDQQNTKLLSLGNMGIAPLDTAILIGRTLDTNIEGVRSGIYILQSLEIPNQTLYGIKAISYVLPSDVFSIGIEGLASGGQTAIGIKGSASGGIDNWSGYFSGNVYVDGDIYYTGRLYHKRLEELERKVYEMEREYEMSKAFYQLEKEQ